MSTQVTLTLPDELYEHAQQWAALMQQNLSETLTSALSLVLTPIPPLSELAPIPTLSDDEVLELTMIQMDSQSGNRLSVLLEKQREDVLNQGESAELATLMQIYNRLWIRQSEAFVEAIRRGLREPIEA
ncbi:MAG: hypothetical protein AAF702_26390 [Chloroflexota bacterium]